MKTFVENQEVIYRNLTGFVKFISSEYITICVDKNPNPLRDVCVVVHPEKWNEVYPAELEGCADK